MLTDQYRGKNLPLQLLYGKYDNVEIPLVFRQEKGYGGKNEDWVVKSIIVTPYTHNGNPIIQSIYDGQQEFIEHPITREFRAEDVLKIVRNGDFTTKRGKFGKLNSVYTLNSNKVIINEKGKVITVFSNRQGRKFGIGKGYIKWNMRNIML